MNIDNEINRINRMIAFEMRLTLTGIVISVASLAYIIIDQLLH